MLPNVSIINNSNWMNWQDTIECLSSVLEISFPSYSIIITDNASENDSVVRIKDCVRVGI